MPIYTATTSLAKFRKPFVGILIIALKLKIYRWVASVSHARIVRKICTVFYLIYILRLESNKCHINALQILFKGMVIRCIKFFAGVKRIRDNYVLMLRTDPRTGIVRSLGSVSRK